MGLEFDFSSLDTQDALDMAVFVENEARDAYEELADWMDRSESSEAAAFFRKMAEFETRHANQLIELRSKLFADSPARLTHSHAFEVEVPDYDEVGSSMTLKDAFELALACEHRAQEYYAGILEYVSDPRTVKIFEDLRDAEDEHIRYLEEERTKLGIQ